MRDSPIYPSLGTPNHMLWDPEFLHEQVEARTSEPQFTLVLLNYLLVKGFVLLLNTCSILLPICGLEFCFANENNSYPLALSFIWELTFLIELFRSGKSIIVFKNTEGPLCEHFSAASLEVSLIRTRTLF